MNPPLGAQEPEKRHLNLSVSLFTVTCIQSMRKNGYAPQHIARLLRLELETVERVLRELAA